MPPATPAPRNHADHPTRAAAPAPPTAVRTTAVRTTALTKRYGTRTVVDGLDLAVPEGVVSGFVGPNGAGKTTTIRMLLGLARPTSGGGEVLGQPLDAPTRYLGAVGAMIEGPAFTPGLSGADNLRVLAHAGRLSVSRIEEVLDRVGLGARGRDPFRSYSLGMKQRLGIAAALLPRPRLLVLDEPTNGLDPGGIAQMRDLLRSLNDDGITVLVSSHLLAEVEQVAHHLVMIQAGRMLFQGSVSDLVEAQRTQLVAEVLTSGETVVIVEAARAVGWVPEVEQGPDGVPPVVRVTLPADASPEDALAAAAALNRRSLEGGAVLARLEVRRPTLEEAFFEMTGTGSGDVR